MKTIIIDQIQQYSQISGNTEKKLYEPAIKLAEATDLAPFVSAQLIADVNALDNDGADRPELRAFHSSFIVPYIAKAVELRLLVTHGNIWAREGIVQIQDSQNTSAPIGDSARNNLLKQCRSDKAVFQTLMQNRFAQVARTFDGVAYDLDSQTNQPKRNASTFKPVKAKNVSKPKKFL